MAYREVSRVEIAEVVPRWQSGISQRQIATAVGERAGQGSGCAHESNHGDPEGATRSNGRHSAAPFPLLRHHAPTVAEPSEGI